MRTGGESNLQKDGKKELIIFFVLLIALSAWAYTPLLITHDLRAGTFWLMWSPGLAALATALITRRSFRGFGWLPGSPKWLLAAYLIPILYSLVAYSVIWAIGIGGVPNPAFLENLASKQPAGTSQITVFLTYLFNLMIVNFIPNMIKPLGEEIGWRGFLLPAMAKHMSYAKAALIIGVIWAIWHYPAILFTNYNIGTPGWFAIPCFTLLVIAGSVVAAWLRVRSGSFWPCVIWHSSHNAIIQAVFTPLTIEREYTKFFIDEMGLGLAITLGIAGWLCWKDLCRYELAAGAEAASDSSG